MYYQLIFLTPLIELNLSGIASLFSIINHLTPSSAVCRPSQRARHYRDDCPSRATAIIVTIAKSAEASFFMATCAHYKSHSSYLEAHILRIRSLMKGEK